ncbi:hypothetical protein GW17_00020713 [Ensete ventricosum]|nr:hypothetical protein GW17_00020713 [Ensete ventricosum]
MARPTARGSWLRLRPPARGQPATTKAPCRGNRQHVRPPAGMASACRGDTYGHRQRPQPGRKGWLDAARPQGAAPPAREVPSESSNAYRSGDCPCRQRAAPLPAQGSDGGAVRVRKEG